MNDFHKPVLIVIAGPNGSGKTSVTSKILHHEWKEDMMFPFQKSFQGIKNRYLIVV